MWQILKHVPTELLCLSMIDYHALISSLSSFLSLSPSLLAQSDERTIKSDWLKMCEDKVSRKDKVLVNTATQLWRRWYLKLNQKKDKKVKISSQSWCDTVALSLPEGTNNATSTFQSYSHHHYIFNQCSNIIMLQSIVVFSNSREKTVALNNGPHFFQYSNNYILHFKEKQSDQKIYKTGITC